MSTALSLLVAAATATASPAGSSASVRLHLADCMPARGLVRDLVGIEIGFGRLVDAGAADLEVHSACEGRMLRIYITRDRPFRGDTGPRVLTVVERRVALADVQAEAGARLVALNIAELVQDVPRQTAAPAVRRAAPPPAPAPEVTGPRLRLGVAPTLRWVPRPDRPVPGVRLSLGWDGGAAWPWFLAVDVGVESNARDLEVGRLTTRVAGGAAQVGLRWSPLERLAVFAAAGLRGGWVWLAGVSGEAGVTTTSGSGPWFGPVGSAFVRYGDRVGVGLGVEGGWTAAGVFGDAAGTRVGLERGWLGGEVRVDWRFGG